jgi:hypothetical protein
MKSYIYLFVISTFSSELLEAMATSIWDGSFLAGKVAAI